MKKAIHIHEFAECLGIAARQVARERDSLCKLDTFIGDGDHGLSAERGFLAAADAAEKSGGSLENLFQEVGAAMSRSMGGAIGPIYGAFWSGAATDCKGMEEPQPGALAAAFVAGVEKVMRVGRAAEGEKTILDAMAPCAQAMLEAAGRGETLAGVMAAGAEAASKGRDATREMAARKGRARFLGEKSVGYVDPGAASFAMFVAEFAQAIKAMEERDPS